VLGNKSQVAESFTVLLDIDGTLVDSNYHHAIAWQRALRRAGVEVLMADVHRSIGLGGDHMVEWHAAGVDAPLEDWWHEEFKPLMPELRPTPGGAALIAHLAESGATNVYATSGNADDVDTLRAIIGADRWISAAVNANEVASSKPAPDILELAMRRAGADPGRTILIGDSTWDVQAANAARLPCIALTCGGSSAAELAAAGAIEVYETPHDLLDHTRTRPLSQLLTT
jgi:phosphoglycolate phosphatase-like HAD superfamily hydrolase